MDGRSFDRPETGRVLVNGEDIGQMSDKQLTLFRRRQIGLVFQAFNLIPTLSAEENILLPRPVPITISYLDSRSQMQLAALR